MTKPTTKRYWRSLDDLSGSPKAERARQREFIAEGADEIEVDGVSRRAFVGIMGASAGLAGVGLQGCVRKPAQYILPYAQRPEDLIPGNPRYFASVLQVGGSVHGVLVESQDGRPTKIEGNPQHPASLGRSNALTQAAVLDLYDTDRSRGAVVDGTPTAVADAVAGLAPAGPGTAILLSGTPSPTLNALAAKAADAGATLYADGADVCANQAAGLALIGASGFRPAYDTAAAKVLVAIDSDFLTSGPNNIAHAAGFGEGRDVERPGGMNRLYAIEPAFSPTGAAADNRYQLPASQIGAFAAALASHVNGGGATAGGTGAAGGALSGTSSDGRFAQWVAAVGDDLLANRGASLVVVGERQPAWVHAVGFLINAALGAVGSTMRWVSDPLPEAEDITALVGAIDAGRVNRLVILGGNPVYSHAGGLDFGAKMDAVDQTVHLGYHYDETGRRADIHIPESHALEAWGDLVAADGTPAIAQPLIEPLYPSRSAIELLGHLVGEHGSGRDLVRARWQNTVGSLDFETAWRRWLHEGIVDRAVRPVAPTLDWSRVAGASQGSAPAMPSTSAIEVAFALDSSVYDGRYANNAWLQEAPDPISKITWDNAALLNPLTARALGIEFGNSAEPTDGDRRAEDENIPSTLRGGLHTEYITVTVDGRSLEIPAVVVPGVAENTVLLPLGYGREFGTVARNAGFATQTLIGADGAMFATGASVAKSGGKYAIATTQDHGSMEGRPLFREATVAEYAADRHFVDGPELMPPEKLYSLWDFDSLPEGHGGGHGGHGDDHGGGHGDDHGDAHGDDHGGDDAHADDHGGHGDSHGDGTREPGQQYWEGDVQQWGMSIDLTTCVACNACTIACQAENNISVVGKERVLEGREMHWIRLDRYFAGDPSNPEVKTQPVTCMQCENAPCEQVCPVAATTHSPSGMNDMAYNRCIGTRYCANNCPYKVRRFNFFNFSRENDDRNSLLRLQRNPDVTVRFRGVMEKCTYCVQRVNAARIDAKVNRPDGKVPDGTIVTACQQACPTGGIVFGDVSDPDSQVSRMRARDTKYALLSWLNTHPRTTYLAKISNPNPELA